MTKQGFRRLIVLSWLLGLAAIAVYMATLAYLPPDLRNFIEAKKHAAPTIKDWVLFALSLFFLISYIVISVGLYKFRVWAKTLLLPINVIALLLMPLYGPSVTHAWASTLNSLCGLVSGGILFLVYFSPVSQMFAAGGDA